MKIWHLFSAFLVLLHEVYAENYTANWNSLDSRPLPLWYDEAKFGIFCHWGVYSVPAHGSEWFWVHWKTDQWPNLQKDADDFMASHYRPNTTYQDFAKDFRAIDFNATEFANLIKFSGAKYFVLTTKHHEGYTLWPSNVSWNWNAKDVGPARDLVAEIRDAILKVGNGSIHWGTYFSQYEWFNPLYLKDQKMNTTKYPTLISYPQMIDLVENYKPDVVWSDGDWSNPSSYWMSEKFLAWLYNESPVKDTVVVNDRWGAGAMCHHGGYFTCQDNFEPGFLQPHKWENCDSIDQNSWGYRNTMKLENVLSLHDFITELTWTISHGGNLLMNIGPDSNGRIIPIFEERLTGIGQFVGSHEEAIFATKPWVWQNESDIVVYTSKLRNASGLDPYRLWNPQQENNTIIYAFVLIWPDDNQVDLTHVLPTKQTTVSLFSTYNQFIPLNYTQPSELSGGIRVSINKVPIAKFPSKDAFAFKIEYAADQNMTPIIATTTTAGPKMTSPQPTPSNASILSLGLVNMIILVVMSMKFL